MQEAGVPGLLAQARARLEEELECPGVWGCGMGTATVLVVDDERKIRDTVRAFLERQHYAVLVAASGQEAPSLPP